MRFKKTVGFIGALVAGVAGAAWAHDGHMHDPNLGHNAPPPLAVLQLDEVRNANARYLDVDQAAADGFVDIGLFMPGMGWHYRKLDRVDGRFDPLKPEFLVYADDPCGGKRKLVAVEYVVPFEDSAKAPQGFFGKADEWDHNVDFGLWTLHAWLYEYNPDGVFAPFNPRVP